MVMFVLPACVSTDAAMADEAAVYDEGSGYIYIPSDLDPEKRYPTLVILSPSGDPDGSLQKWQGIAEELKVILFASRDYRNGVNMESVLGSLAGKISELAINYAIDEEKVVFTGLSGGGMGSHAFSYHHPGRVLGIIVNTGMMHDFYKRASNYPSGKRVAFLASPSDFRYAEMQSDKTFLENLGWKTLWIEFEGGHTLAPDDLCRQALNWILNPMD